MSSLLDDIINLAVDGKQPLPDILRKCLLLAYELKNERLKTWANQELNGYEPALDLPGIESFLQAQRDNSWGNSESNLITTPYRQRFSKTSTRILLEKSTSNRVSAHLRG